MIDKSLAIKFRGCFWEQMSFDERKAVIEQTVHALSDSNNYCVSIVDDNNRTYGRCFPFLHTIEFQDNVCNCQNEKYGSIGEACVYLFYYIAHESFHIKQYNALETEDLNADKNYTMLSCNNVYNNSYIHPSSEHGHLLLDYLYVLQPIERYAWNFANEQINELNEFIKENFPEDGLNEVSFVGISIDDYILSSQIMFRTTDPIRDLDNILLTINGYFVDEPLNEIMCDVIRNTQSIDMVKRLDANQAKNLQHAEEIHCKPSESTLSDEEIEDLFHDRE